VNEYGLTRIESFDFADSHPRLYLFLLIFNLAGIHDPWRDEASLMLNFLGESRPHLFSKWPFANKLTIHILAAVAEHEREAISARTKAALAAAKARGVKLGGPKLQLAQLNGATANKAQADRFAANTLPLIRDAQKTGASSLRAIAKILNDRGVRTARGGKWAAPQVRDILRRAT
jgi:hypothetical protein